MENSSYIKLFRKLLNSPIFENEKALKIWIWCLLKATHREREQLVGRQVVHLEKGQFVFGRKKASEELKMKERTLYDYLKLLEQLSMIRYKFQQQIFSDNRWKMGRISSWRIKKQQQKHNKRTTNAHKQECKE